MLKIMHYLGDEYYLAIIDWEIFEKAEQEGMRRAAALGRIKAPTEQEGILIPAMLRYRAVRLEQDEDKPKLRDAAYCRVSTDSEEQVTSYEAQIEHGEQIAEIECRLEELQHELLRLENDKKEYGGVADEIHKLREQCQDVLIQDAEMDGRWRKIEEMRGFLENRVNESLVYDESLFGSRWRKLRCMRID